MTYYTNIIEYYDILFPVEPARVDYVERNGKGPQRVLEVGCATGCLSKALRDRGHQVVGVDVDSAILDKAMEKAAEGLEFKLSDPLKLDRVLEGEVFDQILCLDNYLAHLPNEMAVRHFLLHARELLKPEGVLTLHLVNYSKLMREGITELPTIEREGVVLKRKNCLEQQGMECYMELHVDGRLVDTRSNMPLFPVKATQMEALLQESGFGEIRMYGDFEGELEVQDSVYVVFRAVAVA
ncbi:class I SAM-dependent methyltransferase [Anaerotalea alkaliphila]|uniref:Class I SAM-dependent methyltransferase n=1 Tax=Anaerotalea alkaliphila TaxID=2662126 RepID=A0A7X5HU01_9FIRM|nr:class I SAM-dependent methyltransferase [Anaerotalea alkaliphila]NDL66628.1 class I SAM-dependent methyltransferase [Anaerotalea alkaliphila]